MRSPWLALAALLGAPNLAHSEPSAAEPVFSASISYVVPPACPSSDDFRAIVVGRLGFDPFVDHASDHVFVSITPGQRSLEGRLEWRDEAGHWAGDQTFPAHTTDCAELARAMGFALAVQINLLAKGRRPNAVRDESPKGATDAAAAGNAAQPRPTGASAPGAHSGNARETGDSGDRVSDHADAATTDAATKGKPWVFGFGGGGTVAVGMSPSVTALGRLFGNIARGPLSFELGGELSIPSFKYRADGAGYTQRVLLASVAGCGVQGPLSLCLLLKAGVLKVAGRSIDVPASPVGKALQTGLRVGLRQRLGEHGFLAERIDGVFNLTRWTVTLDDVPVWTAPIFAGSLGFDAGAVF